MKVAVSLLLPLVITVSGCATKPELYDGATAQEAAEIAPLIRAQTRQPILSIKRLGLYSMALRVRLSLAQPRQGLR